MKINQKILSIPPYISTSWKNVVSLHIEMGALVIGLVNGSAIEIPGLDRPTLEATFAAHQNYLEKEEQMNRGPIPGAIIPPGMMEGSSAMMSLPIQFGLNGNMGNLLQHNSEAADSPDLPKEMLEKITSFSKALGFENNDQLPKPEPHCNCMHCQVMKAMHTKIEKTRDEIDDEEVTDDDLRFREWDIKQTDDKLFVVSNPLNTEEHYNVFLGKPVGCTCGQADCEHIRAVLNS